MSDDGTTINLMNVAQHYYSQPTMDLRFLNGRLQQRFEKGTRIRDDGRLYAEASEWRDVESVTPESPNTTKE
jgi:hypothetical protein